MIALSLAVSALVLSTFAFALAVGRFIADGMGKREAVRLTAERLQAIAQRANRGVDPISFRRAS